MTKLTANTSSPVLIDVILLFNKLFFIIKSCSSLFFLSKLFSNNFIFSFNELVSIFKILFLFFKISISLFKFIFLFFSSSNWLLSLFISF